MNHVIPINDLREHEPCAECWCEPTLENDCPEVLVHHSADHREDNEPDTLGGNWIVVASE